MMTKKLPGDIESFKEKGITRMWLILSFVHFLCCTVTEHIGSFDERYHYFRNCVLEVAFAQNVFSAQ